MIKKIKVAAVVVLCVMLVVSMVLVGCKTTTTETTVAATETTVATTETTTAAETTVASGIEVPKGEVKLDFWLQEASSLELWAKDFNAVFSEKYPNITINIIPLPFEELNAKLIPAVAQGNEADIMFGYSDWLENVDTSKLFAQLTPAIYTMDELKEKQFESSLTPGIGSDGELYALPLITGGNGLGIIVHKDLLEEAGIDSNTLNTWDDIKAAAKKLTQYNDDGTIKRSGLLLNYQETANVFFDMILMQGAADKLYNHDTGVWNYNIPEAKKAMELLQSFVDEKLFDPNVGDAMTAFPNKLGAMIALAPAYLGLFITNYPELKLDDRVIPVFPGGKRAHDDPHWATYMVSKKLEGDKKNAALLYLKEMIDNPAYLNIPFDKGYWLGCVGSKAYTEIQAKAVEEGTANNLVRIAVETSTQCLPATLKLNYRVVQTDMIRNVIYPEIQKVFTGQETIDQMLTYLSEYITSKEQEAMK